MGVKLVEFRSRLQPSLRVSSRFIAAVFGGLALCTAQENPHWLERLYNASVALPSDVAVRRYARSLPGSRVPRLA